MWTILVLALGHGGAYSRTAPKGPLPLEAFPQGKPGPKQFKLAYSGKGMRLSWLTDELMASNVSVGKAPDDLSQHFTGGVTSYSCTEARCGGPYASGQIHMVHLSPLDAACVYYYKVDGSNVRSFTMPAAAELHGPVRFGLIGDLGQTSDSNNTIHHLLGSEVAMVLHAGDLSYADCEQPRWDTYALLADPLASIKPWMTVAGNHEIELPSSCGSSLGGPFKAYDIRYGSMMPYRESASASSQYYSFETAGVHWLMINSYIDVTSSAHAAQAQLDWLEADLKTINRSRTPWLVGVLHAPWYNSNTAHQNEKEEIELRDAMEKLLYDARLDAMFAGHVHAYERSFRVFQQAADDCAPVYINIGDGGNREGLAKGYLAKPSWSAFREASFGHGVFSVHNATHAHWEWHRDQDEERVLSDDTWLVREPSCLQPRGALEESKPSRQMPAELVETVTAR